MVDRVQIIHALSDTDAIAAIQLTWEADEARPAQRMPAGEWDIWLILSGRGWGKTRVGSEQVRRWAQTPGLRIHMVARTAADARDTLVEGESGLLAVCRWDLHNLPMYEPSKRRVSWRNGAQAILFSAEEPDALRGPQCHCWLADEVASWKYLDDTWDMLQFGARLGRHVQGIVTTTPRPIPLIKRLMDNPRVRVTRGSTMDNAANLSPTALTALRTRYEGTRLGRQELFGEVLDDNPGALWRRSDLDAYRVTSVPALSIVMVGVDPAISSGEGADDTGIVVCGRDNQTPAHYYVIDDMTVVGATPLQWGAQAVAAYHKHQANRIVAEVNQGGEMVIQTIKQVDGRVPVEAVHASRGKRTRAEPVSALSEQGRLHFVGTLAALEDSCCEWDPAVSSDSPDRMDAMVWAVTRLMDLPDGNQFGRRWAACEVA